MDLLLRVGVFSSNTHANLTSTAPVGSSQTPFPLLSAFHPEVIHLLQEASLGSSFIQSPLEALQHLGECDAQQRMLHPPYGFYCSLLEKILFYPL